MSTIVKSRDDGVTVVATYQSADEVAADFEERTGLATSTPRRRQPSLVALRRAHDGGIVPAEEVRARLEYYRARDRYEAEQLPVREAALNALERGEEVESAPFLINGARWEMVAAMLIAPRKQGQWANGKPYVARTAEDLHAFSAAFRARQAARRAEWEAGAPERKRRSDAAKRRIRRLSAGLPPEPAQPVDDAAWLRRASFEGGSFTL